MTDQAAGILGLLILLAIVAFVGFWFGWSAILWILVAGVVALIVAPALLKQLRH